MPVSACPGQVAQDMEKSTANLWTVIKGSLKQSHNGWNLHLRCHSQKYCVNKPSARCQLKSHNQRCVTQPPQSRCYFAKLDVIYIKSGNPFVLFEATCYLWTINSIVAYIFYIRHVLIFVHWKVLGNLKQRFFSHNLITRTIDLPFGVKRSVGRVRCPPLVSITCTGRAYFDMFVTNTFTSKSLRIYLHSYSLFTECSR